MAELAISAATAAAVFIELGIPKIWEKLNVDKQVEKDVGRLKTWLTRMQANVKDNNHGTLDGKVEQVRDIAFEIEDVLDEYILHSTHVFHSHKIKQMCRKIGHNIRHGFPLHRIPEKIANIETKLHDLGLLNAALLATDSSSNSASGSGSSIEHQVISPLYLDHEMVGYTKLKETFMSRLMDGEESLVTLAVVGPAGSGKSTFVKNVFQNPRIREQFNCHAWVDVSKEFDLKALFNNMLKEFCNRRMEFYALDVSQVLEELKKYLTNRRYIIVLDDIWKKEHWDIIKVALPDGLLGSRIIVSTRDSNVASLCASSPQFVYELKGLEWLDAWSLFCKIAFKDEKGDCPAKLEECSSEIVTRCERLPFAIVAVARALAQKPKFLNEWESFHKVLGCEIGSDPYLSAIRISILPGYLDLSSNLKSCFLYFGLFPEDYSVERGRLIRLWVAEGFVTGTDVKTAEEVAEIYLDELINRNLVHVSNRGSDGRPKTCRVLSPMLTFIVEKCKASIFASIFAPENTSVTPSIIRRISVLGDCSHLPQSIKFDVIRSVFIFRCGVFLPDYFGNNFRDFKFLRVLDLQGAPLSEFPQQITRLILLKYLSLRGTTIKSIPESIRNLFHLITLDLKQTGVTQLPEAVSRLCNLRHLFVYQYNVDNFVTFDSVRGVKIFEGIEKLTHLQKLSLVKVGKKDGIIRELKKLRQLRKLGLTGIKREHGKDLCSSLELLKNLTTLDLCSNTEDEFLEVGEIQNPSPSIQRLYLKGRLKAFPEWISKLNNLQRIGLIWSKSNDCPLKALKHLPNLMEIHLVDSFEGGELEFEASTFKKLKILVIEKFSRLNTVVIEQGAMPELQKMNLRRCPNLKMLPLGIHNLSKIEELVLHDMAAEFIARLRQHGEEREMVENIPVVHSFTLGNQGCWTLENLSGSFSA